MDICQIAKLFHPQQILNSNITWQLAIFLSFQSSVLVTEKGCLLCHFDHSQPHCFPPSLLLLIFARSQRAMWMFSSFMSRESQIWNVVIVIFKKKIKISQLLIIFIKIVSQVLARNTDPGEGWQVDNDIWSPRLTHCSSEINIPIIITIMITAWSFTFP